MTAQELEAMMVKQYGPDFREKALVGPLTVFFLADVFDECGLHDPQRPEPSTSYGLWQFTPSSASRHQDDDHNDGDDAAADV